MSAHFDIDCHEELWIDCFCAKCQEELEIKESDNFERTIYVEPCKKCRGAESVTILDTQSLFFKDLMEFTEKKFGREVASRIELFALTWHGRQHPDEN